MVFSLFIVWFDPLTQLINSKLSLKVGSVVKSFPPEVCHKIKCCYFFSFTSCSFGRKNIIHASVEIATVLFHTNHRKKKTTSRGLKEKIVGIFEIRIMSLFNPLPNVGDDTFAFPSQCFMLKFNGAWPLEHDKVHTILDRLYLAWAYALIVLIALTCYVQAAYLFASWGDVLTVTECGCTVFMGLHNLLRLMHLSYKRGSLKKLIASFVKDIWISK